jgi:hypothetical protein
MGTSGAEYQALQRAADSDDGAVPDELGPSLADKGLAEANDDGTYRITLDGLGHVGY